MLCCIDYCAIWDNRKGGRMNWTIVISSVEFISAIGSSLRRELELTLVSEKLFKEHINRKIFLKYWNLKLFKGAR